jgi:hypothetical protein
MLHDHPLTPYLPLKALLPLTGLEGIGQFAWCVLFVYTFNGNIITLKNGHIFYSRGGGDSEGIKIEGGRERKEEKGGRRGGEKEHLPFIYSLF